MHNIMSFNQLADWNNVADNTDIDHDELINDYYDCLIECVDDTASCKRICKEILV